jgi:hypothetical protein
VNNPLGRGRGSAHVARRLLESELSASSAPGGHGRLVEAS